MPLLLEVENTPEEFRKYLHADVAIIEENTACSS